MAAPGAHIRFIREPRPDKTTMARGDGFGFLGYRLRSVVVSMDGGLLRVYQLRYEQSRMTGASIVSTIEQLGRDAVLGGDWYTAGRRRRCPRSS